MIQKEDQNAPRLDCESLLDDIEKKLNETQFELANGEYVIKEYCREMRRQVQLAKEVKIYDLEKASDQFMQKIDAFEQDKLENCKRLSNKSNFERKLDEIKSDLNKWRDSDKSRLDPNELDRIIDARLDLLIQKRDIWSNLFKHETLDFFKKPDDPNGNSLGQLVSDTSDRINFKESYCVDLSKNLRNYLNSSQEVFVIKTVLLDSNKFIVVVFENRDGFDHNLIKLFLFDENKLFQKEKSLSAAECDSPIYSVANKICIQYVNSDTRLYLSVLDGDLEELSHFEVKHKEHLVGANLNYLFMLAEEAMRIYDWSFNLVSQIGQTSLPNEAYNLSKVNTFDMRNNRLYLIENKRFREHSLRVVCQSSGRVIRQINFRMLNQFYIDENDRLVVIESNRLVYFNRDGLLLKQINFDELNFNLHICLNTSSNLVHLFDEDEYLVHIKKLYV